MSILLKIAIEGIRTYALFELGKKVYHKIDDLASRCGTPDAAIVEEPSVQD